MKTAPKCRACWKSAVPADAGILRSIPYWYCRTCKIEVDEFGREVHPQKPEGLEELEDYLSGEIGRFDHEYVGQFHKEEEEKPVTIYDPFHRRSRKVFQADLKRPPPPPVEEDDEEEDEEVLGFWDPGVLPENF